MIYMMIKKLNNTLKTLQKEIDFSCTVYAKAGDTVFTKSYGLANRSEKIVNETNTRYGIASGCKIFTAIAICQLVEMGKLTLHAKLKDCLDVKFPHFDEQISLHHLLTHTSGIPDYFDEEEMDNFEALWIHRPMYLIRSLNDFLPFFQNEKMKDAVGSTFHYNNAGYIVLGLVIEQASGLAFTDYVQRYIFNKAVMHDSGYFEMDALPEKVAHGYIEKPDGGYRTNVYAIPAKGGSDGGAYVTARDFARLWQALTNHKLLSKAMTARILAPHTQVDEDIYYGYGLYMETNQAGIVKYILMGYDPGLNFRAVFYPKQSLHAIVCSNQSDGAYEMITEIQKVLL